MSVSQQQVDQLRKQINAYKLSLLLMAADRVGVFEQLSATSMSVETMCSGLGLPKDRLSVILDALVANGFLEKDKGAYRLAAEFDALDPSHPASQVGYLRYASEVMSRWLKLEDAVRGEEVATGNFAEITGVDPEATRAFVQAMDANARSQAAYVAKTFDFTGHRLLDVGAGAGTYSTTIGRAFTDASGVLLELPGTASLTEGYVKASGLETRFRVVRGDYREALPSGQFDDVLLFACIHQESEEGTLALLREVAAVLKPGGRLFLTSFFTDETRTKPLFASMFAVEMLVMVPSGKVYSYDEVEGLLRRATFSSFDRFDDIPGPATLYVARR